MNFETNSDLFRELESAVNSKHLQTVRAVLLRGADPNFIYGCTWRANKQETLLHTISSVEIAKELILHGAVVDVGNKRRESALYLAVFKGKSFEFVSLLLKHGACVNSLDRKGNTPLNIAVQRSRQSDQSAIIKALLEYGADINIRNRDRHFCPYGFLSVTPLDVAMDDFNPERVKMLIRYTLIQRIGVDYKKNINLSPYIENHRYGEITSYLDECICEIVRMQSDKVNNNLSLYELLLPKSPIFRTYPVFIITKAKELSTNYPIYEDILLKKLQLHVERTLLMNKLSEQEICIRAEDNATAVKEIHLNFDTAHYIALYLSTEDLSNFVTAVDVKKTEPVDLGDPVELPTNLDETCDIRCAKRAKY